MTTLSLSNRDTGFLGTTTLSRWLNGRWALLFSHPDDFACRDMECDRWLVVVDAALTSAGIRPLALESSTRRLSRHWIHSLHETEFDVRLESSPAFYSDEREFNAIVLRSVIEKAPQRFVMIVDDALKLRRTFTYAAGDRLPSVLDFATAVDHLRRRTLRADALAADSQESMQRAWFAKHPSWRARANAFA